MTDEEQANKTERLAVLLNEATDAERVGNYNKAEECANEVLSATDPALRIEAELYSNALHLLGNVMRVHGNNESALDRYSACLAIAEKYSDSSGVARALGSMGLVYLTLSESTRALEYFSKAMILAEELGDKTFMLVQLGNTGNVYFNLSEYTQALECFEKALVIAEEIGNNTRVALCLGNIGNVRASLSDYANALQYYGKALSLDESLGNKGGMARWLGNIGNIRLSLSDYAGALEYFHKALSIDEELENMSGVATGLGNIGIVHINYADYTRALEYLIKALSLCEELGDRRASASQITNIGTVHLYLSDHKRALAYFNEALRMNEELENKDGLAKCLTRMGVVHSELFNYSQALEYHEKALQLALQMGQKASVALALGNIATIYEKQLKYDRAFDCLVQGMHTYEEIGTRSLAGQFKGAIGARYANVNWERHDARKAELHMLESIAESQELGTKDFKIHKTLADLYKQQNRWKESLEQFEEYYRLEMEVQSEEAKKKAIQMEQQKLVDEREKEVVLAKVAAAAELNATRGLLDSILPTSIATRMISGETRIADYFPMMSILFADIVGFTSIATEVPPDVVIDFLNHVFDVYDEIIKRHGCEKIKTIGDGYMAVAGAPISCEDHAERIARAAIEMQNDIILPQEIRAYLPKNSVFNIRVGIHTGAAVCGVIGKERFVWDVYSDAVNIAARMESSGVAGKIQVSKDFAWLLRSRQKMMKSTEEFVLEERGEVEIKGKGMMRTYFLEANHD